MHGFGLCNQHLVSTSATLLSALKWLPIKANGFPPVGKPYKHQAPFFYFLNPFFASTLVLVLGIVRYLCNSSQNNTTTMSLWNKIVRKDSSNGKNPSISQNGQGALENQSVSAKIDSSCPFVDFYSLRFKSFLTIYVAFLLCPGTKLPRILISSEFRAPYPYQFRSHESRQWLILCFGSIVAIHGLTGHWRQTWTHDNGACWLTDFLPDQFPNARIMAYGYNANIFLSKAVTDIK
jgi:hypothetical protein